MKKLLLLTLACFITVNIFGQDLKKDSLGGVMAADQVKVSQSGKRKEKADAAIRAKAKELTRDLLEKNRLQFEPEYGRYHGYYRNLNNEKFTKKAANSAYGSVFGAISDENDSEFSGKPVIQIFNGHFYCNLDVILRHDTKSASSTNLRNSANSHDLTDNPTSSSDQPNLPEFTVASSIDESGYSAEWEEMDKIVFNTEAFEITNIKNPNDYITTYDVIVKQPFSIDNVYYDQFIFQCAMNILDARMAVRIIAGQDRICTTYHGDMNYIRGGSF